MPIQVRNTILLFIVLIISVFVISYILTNSFFSATQITEQILENGDCAELDDLLHENLADKNIISSMEYRDRILNLGEECDIEIDNNLFDP